MKKLLRVAATVVAGLSLSGTGIAMASSGGINQTGANSDNNINHNHTVTHVVANNTNLGVVNSRAQNAVSGDVHTSRNTTVGGSASGAADNADTFNVGANVNNAASSGQMVMPMDSNTGSINSTGADSNNNVNFNDTLVATVSNNNNLSVVNSLSQNAQSGEVTVRRNTTANGGATSGEAYNISTTNVSFNVAN